MDLQLLTHALSVDFSSLSHFFIAHPLDIGIALLSYVAGRLMQKAERRSIGIFMQVSILLLRMAKHYADTHPTAKKTVTKRIHDEINRLHHKAVKQIDKNEGAPG